MRKIRSLWLTVPGTKGKCQTIPQGRSHSIFHLIFDEGPTYETVAIADLGSDRIMPASNNVRSLSTPQPPIGTVSKGQCPANRFQQ